MNHQVRALFIELVDRSNAEREQVFAERRIAPEVRLEVESLLSFDHKDADSLADCVAETAADVLDVDDNGEPASCGPYRLMRLLGTGGMGSVYLGERTDGEIQQRVAVKLLHAGNRRPGWEDRFLKERQLLASLNHPAIARVIDAGHTDHGMPYLVMEYVDGVPIDVFAETIELRERLALFLLVCDAVSNAHRNLIIHRDLKPSNILVDAAGQPKLLDFGIAKLVDDTAEPTQTLERLLTPNYASPEQLRGDHQTTSTDVYSLGAVLYKMLTGRSPHESDTGQSRSMQVIAGIQQITSPSSLNPHLPSDIDYVLRKALRNEPEARYASVDAFAGDIAAFLDSRPVEARSGDTWYRTRKFLRRYRVTVAAAAIAIVGLSIGVYTANHQRTIAQRRFQQVRQLANKILALDKMIGVLPGGTAARNEIVAISKEYLEALGTEARLDQDLALDVGEAYSLLARSQGVPTGANLGQYAQAEQSLRKAESLVDPILAANPLNRKALMTSARVSHDRMILAETDHRDEQARTLARKTVARIDTLLGLPNPSLEELEASTLFVYNIALAHKNMHLLDDALRYARRSLEITRRLPADRQRLDVTLSMVADTLRLSGDLDGALAATREAMANLNSVAPRTELARRSSLFSVLTHEGEIFGALDGINLDRAAEAVSPLQRAFDSNEEWARKDPMDASSRILVASAGRILGGVLTQTDPRRALAVYDQGLLRLREIENNVKARREEVTLLAGSSYALRGLHRSTDSKKRIDHAFRLLSETKNYPTDRIVPGSEADQALTALADYYAETGEPRKALDVYQDLASKILASKPDVRTDLRHAMRLSRLYEAQAALLRREGDPDGAKTLAANRLDIWRQWDTRLPANGFIHRQLTMAIAGR